MVQRKVGFQLQSILFEHKVEKIGSENSRFTFMKSNYYLYLIRDEYNKERPTVQSVIIMVLGREDLLLPIGILCLALSIIFNWYLPGTFLDGVFIGLSIGFTLISILRTVRDRVK